MSKLRFAWRKGISPLLAVIITIAIVIAIGGFVFAWTFGLIRTGSAVADLAVVDSSIVITAEGKGAFSVTVKNIGTVTANSITITEQSGYGLKSGGNPVSISFSNLAPGKSASTTISLDNAEIGKTYIFKVVASFADGSAKTLTFTVRAQQA